MNFLSRTAAFLGFSLIFTLMMGCAAPAPPPLLSSAPYVRTPLGQEEGELGQISASVGILIDPGDTSFIAGESKAVFRLASRYDLSFGGRPDVFTLEGNLRLITGPFQLGWTHGVGGAAWIQEFSLEASTLHATTGLSFQFGQGERQLFGAFRYAYAHGLGPYLSRSYLIASLGFQTPLIATLSLSPEIHVLGNSEGDIYLAPTLAASARF